MTIATAIRIAREFGLTLASGHGHSFTLIEARHINMNAARAARITAKEWRTTCSNIAHNA